MKFTFLGTASCEGIPALFCNCPRCAAARALGGKNIRTRAQALIDDNILIDLPPDTLYHFHQNGIEGHKIKHLLITHSHSDHLTPKELHNRGPRRCDNMDAQVLHVWCSKGSYDAITAVSPREDYVQLHLIKPFEPFTVGNYQVTALPANHHNGDEAVIYLIEGEKTLLYALDSGYFLTRCSTISPPTTSNSILPYTIALLRSVCGRTLPGTWAFTGSVCSQKSSARLAWQPKKRFISSAIFRITERRCTPILKTSWGMTACSFPLTAVPLTYKEKITPKAPSHKEV